MLGPGPRGPLAQHTKVGVRVITKPDSIDCYLGALAPSSIACYNGRKQTDNGGGGWAGGAATTTATGM